MTHEVTSVLKAWMTIILISPTGLAVDKKRGQIWPDLLTDLKRMASYEADRSDTVQPMKKNMPDVAKPSLSTILIATVAKKRQK